MACLLAESSRLSRGIYLSIADSVPSPTRFIFFFIFVLPAAEEMRMKMKKKMKRQSSATRA
jgi:hypothetical protein